MSMNKVIILGRLGKDPEGKPIQGGTVCSFVMATSDKYKEQERTEWHNITCFGKTAELCLKYLQKGSQCLVEGKLQTRSWEDPNSGQKRFMTEIIASHVQFLDKKKQDGGGIY